MRQRITGLLIGALALLSPTSAGAALLDVEVTIGMASSVPFDAVASTEQLKEADGRRINIDLSGAGIPPACTSAFNTDPNTPPSPADWAQLAGLFTMNTLGTKGNDPTPFLFVQYYAIEVE